MSTIFNLLESTATRLLTRLERYTPVDEGHRFSWPNFVFTDKTFRRAHLDIVDARESKKLYMLHLTVMPHTNDPAPIFGFDIIAGPNKVTGAFHDFSPVLTPHPMLNWFEQKVSSYTWSKQRELPEWARNIFSPSMVAASNIHDEKELKAVLDLVEGNLEYYLQNTSGAGDADYTKHHNYYCANQKKNPHTPRVMAALGLPEDEVTSFIETCLFPELDVLPSSVRRD